MQETKDDLKKIGLVGEEINALMVYLCCTSRVLDNPLSLILKGSSSSGKSHTVKKVLTLMPHSSYKEFAYMSPKSILHMEPEDLKHKVLFIAERPGAEAADYSIRILQSDGKIKIATVVKDEATGSHMTEQKEVEGPVAYIETTTQPLIHAENETRLFSLFSDETIDQTKRVHEHLKDRYRLEPAVSQAIIEQIICKHRVAQLLLKKVKVVIPFVEHIAIPAAKVRSRRDFGRFLSLIEISAVLHQYQRERFTKDGEEYINASSEDYKVAYNLAYSTIMEGLCDVTPKARQLYKVCQEFEKDFSREDMREAIGWNLEEVKKYASILVHHGYFAIVRGRKGQKYCYEIAGKMNAPTETIISPEELEIKTQSRPKSKIILRIKRK